jgi:hypothetical protein
MPASSLTKSKKTKLSKQYVDLTSKKLPIILIVVLLGILAMQYFSNDTSGSKLIDPETCELYIKDPRINSKQYLDEYDSKCLEFKNLNP